MKTKLLLQLLLLITATIFFASTKTYAQVIESEPNDVAPAADSFPLNGSGAGNINVAGDVDWWKVKTNVDGDLTILISGATNLRTVYIYDTAGTILLTSATVGHDVGGPTQPGLAPGTYFIKVKCYYDWETGGNYTVSSSLSVAIKPNDKEPNNVFTKAITLALNSSAKGHIGYYYNNRRDSSDWYKVTTNSDGKLNITFNNSGNNNLINLILCDKDGATVLGSANVGNGIGGFSTDGLAAGTYYIRIKDYYGTNAYGPYTISDTLIEPIRANDTEPNNQPAKALQLSLNSSTTGHYGYYYNHQRDSSDWYKLTTTNDGVIKLTLDNTGNPLASLRLYDNDGTTLLNQGNIGGGIGSISTDGLAAGTYYIQIKDYYSNTGFGPYKLTDTLIEPRRANDIEPNNQRSDAQKLVVNRSKTGHYGYYYNHQRDSSDWYKLTTTTDGMIKLILDNTGNTLASLRLYDNDGTTLLNQANVGGGIGGFSSDGLAAGTYYIQIKDYYSNTGFGPYKLTDSLIMYNYTTDQEPDNRPYQANSLPVNSTLTGHVNFYYKNEKDTTDWYLLNYTDTTQRLSLTVTLAPSLINNTINAIHFDVYKDTLKPAVLSKAFFSQVNKFTLPHGKYYIKIYADNESTGYSAYSITNSAPATFYITQSNLKIDDLQFAWNISGNAAANNCSVQLKLNTDANVSVQVISLTGNPVQNIQKGKLQKGSYSIPLNLNNAIAGIYVVNLTIDNKSDSKKIMK